jgi:hypothetical protein
LFLATLVLLFSPSLPMENPDSNGEQSAVQYAHAEESASAHEAYTLPDAPQPKADAEASSSSITAAASPLRNAPAKPAVRGGYETARERKIWYGLVALGHSAAAFDAYSTRRAISGNYGVETDPVMRPFANSNAMYFATQVTPTILDYVGHRMMTSEHPWMRRMWWVPQVAGSSLSLGAGIHNYRLAP